MGGSGSTRWGWHSKKTQVEACHKLTIFAIKPYLHPGWGGTLRWSRGEQAAGSISYMIQGHDTPNAIRLIYTINAQTKNAANYDYPVRLVTSRLAWGKERYWFICPSVGCGRRVGCLYLAPGSQYFACRHCYQLTYESQQEGYRHRAFYDFMAGMMQDVLPGATAQDMKFIMKDK